MRPPEPPARVSGAGPEDRGPARGAGRRGDLSRGGSSSRARVGASGVELGAQSSEEPGMGPPLGAGRRRASLQAGGRAPSARLRPPLRRLRRARPSPLEGTGPGSGGRTSAGHWTRASRSEIWAGFCPLLSAPRAPCTSQCPGRGLPAGPCGRSHALRGPWTCQLKDVLSLDGPGAGDRGGKIVP